MLTHKFIACRNHGLEHWASASIATSAPWHRCWLETIYHSAVDHARRPVMVAGLFRRPPKTVTRSRKQFDDLDR